MFNLAIDSKLRACDLTKLRVRDVCLGTRVAPRAAVMQQKTQRPVQFKITEQTRDSVESWIKVIELYGLKGPDVIGVLYRHISGDESDPGGAREARLKRCSADKLEAKRIVEGRYRVLIPLDVLRSKSSK